MKSSVSILWVETPYSTWEGCSNAADKYLVHSNPQLLLGTFYIETRRENGNQNVQDKVRSNSACSFNQPRCICRRNGRSSLAVLDLVCMCPACGRFIRLLFSLLVGDPSEDRTGKDMHFSFPGLQHLVWRRVTADCAGKDQQEISFDEGLS
jgi:hypothetical protein